MHKVSAFGTWTIQQAAYNGDPKYNTTKTTPIASSTNLSNNSSSSSSQQQQQSYKVGWLRVSRDEQRLPPPDASIGDMVKNIIINGNRNNQQNDIYFAVLKHTTLYLYDSERQLDCKGVIQVNQHKVMTHPSGLEDHELFTRPHLIKLIHKENKNSHYYINCNKCIDKEDWYFALLRSGSPIVSAAESFNSNTTTATASDRTFSQQEKESSIHFDQDAMNKLLTTIHSDEHHFQTQWFNAMLGRIFCGVYKTDTVNTFLYNKLISKLDKINARRPAFLGEITVRSVDPGHAPPFITQPRLLGLSPTGVLTAEANMQYEGGIRFEIETVLKWKYSDHLRPLTVDLVLAITLKSLHGKFLLKVKEPPTNRLWYGFYELPKMEWLVEPVVWERRVGYSMVVKAIQSKIDELVMENAVLPNLDDITFFPTNGVGGIFGSPSTESQEEPPIQTSPATAKDTKKTPLTASASLPELFDKQEPTKPKMKRWFTSKDTMTTAIVEETNTPIVNDDPSHEDILMPIKRPPAKMMTSFSDSAREQKSQRSFIDAILNRKPTQHQQLQQREKQNNINKNNNTVQDTTAETISSSIESSEPTSIPAVAISSSPGSSSISTSSVSSSSDPSDHSSNSSLSRLDTSTSPSFKHALPIPIITTELEQYDSDYDNETSTRSSSLTTAISNDDNQQQRQLRLRKSASLARLKAKTMASTAVSQINVSPKMHKAELINSNNNNNKLNYNNNDNNCSDAATVMSSVHQSAAIATSIEKPIVSTA